MMLMTKKYNVMLNSLTVQKTVFAATERCSADVVAENESDGYAVNAKSVLGFFSLDLNRPVTITTNTERDAEIIEAALKKNNVGYSVA